MSSANGGVITAVNWETGAVATPGPMVVVHPDRQITEADLADVAAGTGLNGPFVAQLLASCLTHENMGVSLFRALGARTTNPMAQKQFASFRKEAEEAVAVWAELMRSLGVPPGYASPPARLTEAVDAKLVEAFLLTGAADPLTIELKGVEAVLLAATLCVANVSLLERLADGIDAGGGHGAEARAAMSAAAARLRPPAEEHLAWAAGMQQTMVLGAANSTLAHRATQAVAGVVGKVKDLLGPPST